MPKQLQKSNTSSNLINLGQQLGKENLNTEVIQNVSIINLEKQIKLSSRIPANLPRCPKLQNSYFENDSSLTISQRWKNLQNTQFSNLQKNKLSKFSHSYSQQKVNQSIKSSKNDNNNTEIVSIEQQSQFSDSRSFVNELNSFVDGLDVQSQIESHRCTNAKSILQEQSLNTTFLQINNSLETKNENGKQKQIDSTEQNSEISSDTNSVFYNPMNYEISKEKQKIQKRKNSKIISKKSKTIHEDFEETQQVCKMCLIF